jgi:hypothetical protein
MGRFRREGISVRDNPVQVADLIAAICDLEKLGIDYEKQYQSNIGRPVKLTDKGTPLESLLV